MPGCFPPFKTLSLSHQIERRLMQNADRSKIPSSLVLIRHILTPGCKYFPFSQNIYLANQAIHLDDVDIDCVSPITAHCAPCPGCLVGTIITSTIESHLACFDKSREHLQWHPADGPGPSPLVTCYGWHHPDPAHMVTLRGRGSPVIRWNVPIFGDHIELFILLFWDWGLLMLVGFVLFLFIIQERPLGSLFHWALLIQRMQGYEDNTAILTSLANYPETQLTAKLSMLST